ncbi:hypothetical protein [Anaerocolumna chitinilytica]|nr:hypothetical protein [Anaerocolumna chitinilytica]
MAGEKSNNPMAPDRYFQELFSMFFYRMKKTKVINVETFKMGKNHKRISMFSIIAVAITTFNLGYSYLISNRLISGVAFLICFVMLIIDIFAYFWKNNSAK